jgi:F0F1-type ATP synthase assembly protein I
MGMIKSLLDADENEKKDEKASDSGSILGSLVPDDPPADQPKDESPAKPEEQKDGNDEADSAAGTKSLLNADEEVEKGDEIDPAGQSEIVEEVLGKDAAEELSLESVEDLLEIAVDAESEAKLVIVDEEQGEEAEVLAGIEDEEYEAKFVVVDPEAESGSSRDSDNEDKAADVELESKDVESASKKFVVDGIEFETPEVRFIEVEGKPGDEIQETGDSRKGDSESTDPMAVIAEPQKIDRRPKFVPESKAETIRKSGLAYSAAIALFGSVIFMLIMGWFADLLLGIRPWGIVIGIVLGAIIGFVQFFRLTSQIINPKPTDFDRVSLLHRPESLDDPVEDVKPETEESPAEVEEEAQAEAEEKSPADAKEKAPAEAEEEPPADAKEEAPADVKEKAPADVKEKAPAEAEEKSPAEAEESTADAKEETPAEAEEESSAEVEEESQVEEIEDTSDKAEEEESPAADQEGDGEETKNSKQSGGAAPDTAEEEGKAVDESEKTRADQESEDEADSD